MIEVLKGAIPGGYLLLLATAIAAIQFAAIARFARRQDFLEICTYLVSFSYVGMPIGFLIGFTKTPGTVGTVLPAVLTFMAGVFGVALLRETRREMRILLSLMMSTFAASLTVFLFVGLRLRVGD
ncbi:MAG: hypothetical protein Q8L56_00075 [Rhodocyclaceae bacterium]|nr:hypothetical protein [Rhodocyclaceae bacterium]